MGPYQKRADSRPHFGHRKPLEAERVAWLPCGPRSTVHGLSNRTLSSSGLIINPKKPVVDFPPPPLPLPLLSKPGCGELLFLGFWGSKKPPPFFFSRRGAVPGGAAAAGAGDDHRADFGGAGGGRVVGEGGGQVCRGPGGGGRDAGAGLAGWGFGDVFFFFFFPVFC